MRQYVLLREVSDESVKNQIRQEMIQKLAREWNTLNAQIERLSWRDEDERDDEADYHAEMAEEFAEDKVSSAIKKDSNLSKEDQNKIRQSALNDYYFEKDKKDNEIFLKKEVVEELLSQLGARMARPYEHWNEEERYMEYMESRYDNRD